MKQHPCSASFMSDLSTELSPPLFSSAQCVAEPGARVGTGQGTPCVTGMPRGQPGHVPAGRLLCRMKGSPHRGGYQTGEEVFPSPCILFLFGSIFPKEKTRWIFYHFQNFPETPVSIQPVVVVAQPRPTGLWWGQAAVEGAPKYKCIGKRL